LVRGPFDADLATDLATEIDPRVSPPPESLPTMPRRASYSLATVQALPAQTVYSSESATRRQIQAAEDLIPTIDARADYALCDALQRIFGAEIAAAAGEIVSGRALRADLATLVLELSARVAMRPDERPGGSATPEELAREIGVASKTLQRWRRAGLCAHWVFDHGKQRVEIYRASLERFAADHPSEFARARSFRRFDADERSTLLDEARALLERGTSLNLAAKQLALRCNRSHEGVRLLLLRAFGARPSARRGAGEQVGRLVERAWRLGIDPTRIAQRIGRSESLVRALVDRRRGELLRGVQPSWVDLPTFDLPGADETIPSAPSVRKLQPLGLADGELLAMIGSAREIRRLFARDARAANERDETRGAAMHYLLRRASRAIDAMPRWPDRATVDQIETDLRAALRLRALLAERGLVIALGRADQAFEGGPERLPADELRTLVRELTRAVQQVVVNFDPSRQRFDRAISLAADYAIAKLTPTRRPARAAARHATGIAMHALGEVAQWQGIVDPMAHHAPLLAAALPRGPLSVAARLVARRHGFCGLPPRTVEQLAAEDRTTVALMSKRLRDAENAVRAAARNAAQPA
jgi:hypothetical protein